VNFECGVDWPTDRKAEMERCRLCAAWRVVWITVPHTVDGYDRFVQNV